MSKKWYIFRAAAGQALAARDYVRAEALWYAALEEAEDFGEHSPRLTDTLEGLGEVEFRLGKYLNAAVICKRLLRVYSDVFGADHLNVGVISKNLAMLYEHVGKKEEAAMHYDTALRLHRAHFGPEDPQVSAIVSSLANLLVELGRLDEAITLQKQSGSSFDPEEWRKSGTWKLVITQTNPSV